MNQEQAKVVFGDWAGILRPYLETPEFEELRTKLRPAENVTYYPDPRELVFLPFRLNPLKDLRVIILGEDPYPLPGMSDGLAFSVKPDITRDKYPASLRSLLAGMENDVLNGEPDTIRDSRNGSLQYLAGQGVMLLNTALTIKGKNADGTGEVEKHTELWAPFTQFVINAVSQFKNKVIIVALGTKAMEVCKELDVFRNNCFYLQAEHPIVGAKRESEGGLPWEHKHIFTYINEIIRINDQGATIDWLPKP